MTNQLPDKPSNEAIQAAKDMPNGWVYQIDGKYKIPSTSPIPPEAILGAWKVNSSGEIIGSFIPNPNYKELKEEE
jgi:hypothetical protein